MAIIYILTISYQVGIFIIILVVTHYFITKFLNKKYQAIYKAYKSQFEKYNVFLMDIISRLKDIRLLNAFKYIKKLYIIKEKAVLLGNQKLVIQNSLRKSYEIVLESISDIILYSVSALVIIKGKMQLGDFIALMIYYEWAKLFLPISANAIVGLTRNFVSVDRIIEFLNLEDEIGGSETCEYGDIEIKNLEFSYDRNTILNGVNMRINCGESVAIAGNSGCGKSTIANLLLKMYEPDGGEIYIGNQSINQVDNNKLRKLIGIVRQETAYFEGTIRKNLCLVKGDATEEELWGCLELAQAKEFVEKLPNGLDTFVTEAENLSTGQIQRLMLARILLKDSQIIILDEATSNIDTETEFQFIQDIKKVTQNKILIIIAYRKLSLELADRIYFIDNGKILDYGTHYELLERCPEYNKLVKAAIY